MDRPIHYEIPFGLKEAGDNPFALFAQWFKTAVETDPNNAGVMTLATATGSRPSARMVLLKEYGQDGFVFYTHYLSRKGREIDTNPQAALVFWWPHTEQQIRIEGASSKKIHPRPRTLTSPRATATASSAHGPPRKVR